MRYVAAVFPPHSERPPFTVVIEVSQIFNRIAQDQPLTDADVEEATIDGAVQRLRPRLMTVTAVILSLAPILWEPGIGWDVMTPIAAPIVGGMITSTIHVLILVPCSSCSSSDGHYGGEPVAALSKFSCQTQSQAFHGVH